MKNWTLTSRPTGECWLHNDSPIWIVHYPLAHRGPVYMVFEATAHIPRGCMPWSVNNRRIGDDCGFKTLEQARQCAEKRLEARKEAP